VAGAVNVAHAARDNRCRGLIHFSTARVWGLTTSPEGRSEDASPAPGDNLGKMALEAEQKLLEDFNDGSFPVVVLRPVTVFGKGDERGGCAKIIAALQRGFFPLLDGGAARRSLLHAENLADRVERLIDKGWKGGATYGVSDFNVSLCDFTALVKEHCRFALTPAVPLSLAGHLQVLDRYLSPLLPVETPVADAIARMSTDFVIHTRLFEHDYGYAPRLSLREAVAATLS